MGRKATDCENRTKQADGADRRLQVVQDGLERPSYVICLVAGFIAWVLLTSCAVSADGEIEMGPAIDLRAGCPARPVGWAPSSMPTEAEIHFCNEGVDAPALFGTFQVGALFLTRSRAKAEPTGKIFGQADDRLLLDSGDLDLGTSYGLDITAIVRLGGSMGVETRYFGITDWSAARTVTDPLGTGVRFEGFGTSIPAVSEQVDYTSQLYNFEVNVLPLVTEGVPLVLGFRSLQLHERFELWQVDPLPRSLGLGSRANNYLYGFQIGAEPYLVGAGGALRLDGLIKAGIYGNHASQGVFSPLLGTSVEARRDLVAFAGELGVAIVYRFNRSFALRGGYELVWLSRVALAPDQGRKTNLAVPSAELDLGTAFLHGAAASLEFAF